MLRHREEYRIDDGFLLFECETFRRVLSSPFVDTRSPEGGGVGGGVERCPKMVFTQGVVDGLTD